MSKRDLPREVMARARQSLLDYIAVASAGAQFQKAKLQKYCEFLTPEDGVYSAIGMRRRLALKEAVFLNGLNGHALDFDDGTNSGIIHLGSPIFSLLLPLAERYDISIDKLLCAAVIGYETSYTAAASIQPGHKALGYHATGTCGVLGAVIAASYMLGFTEEERLNAFSAACASASGMLMVLDDGCELKPFNVAKSALMALTSLQLGKAGFAGHPDPLGSSRGFLKMMTGRDDVVLRPVLLDGTYAIQKTYTKPYASCRYTHPAVEAAIHLRNRHDLRAEDMESVYIRTYSLAVAGHDHTDIPSPYSAKMSIPFSTAAALIYGRAGLQEFTEESIRDKALLDLTKKVSVVSDEALSDAFPGIQAAVVEIRTKHGVVSDRVDYPKGEPENPMSDEEFRARYDGLMAYAGIEKETADAVFETVYRADAAVRELGGKI